MALYRKMVTLTHSQIKELEHMSDISISEHIRRAIDDYVQKHSQTTAQSPSRTGGSDNER